MNTISLIILLTLIVVFLWAIEMRLEKLYFLLKNDFDYEIVPKTYRRTDNK